MFSSFRHKLLFWFLAIGGSNIILLLITNRYLEEREHTIETTDLVESAYIYLLKDVKTLQDFFSYETKNEEYFKTGKSIYLQKHAALLDSTLLKINTALASRKIDALTISTDLSATRKQIDTINHTFDRLIVMIKERGYKEFSLEGEMRYHAHWIENSNWMEAEKVLSLRRYEKDYIIRNEEIYVTRLNDLAQTLQAEVKNSRWLTTEKKDSLSRHLTAYQERFNKIVALDKMIGIKDNSGDKRLLDLHIQTLESTFDVLVGRAKARQQVLLQQLNYYYLATALIMIVIGISVSYWISKKITIPLVELTQYITRFVDNNFQEIGGYPAIKSKDEIGKLSRHFQILKEEVMTRLQYFQKKVDERTKELSQVNQKLLRMNEANSRFVPKEFLQFLSKDSIEEGMLGDQVEHEMTVMFTDIRSFTRISESLSPQENFDFINGYLKEIVPVIRRHRGFIDKYIGDSVMALFPDSPDAAVLAALEFEKSVQNFNHYLAGKGISPILIGSGIHTGRLILGTIGNDQRLETTVISDSVNIASRMEGLTKHYGCNIVISEAAVNKLSKPDQFNLRHLDTVKVKGKSASLSVYAVLNDDEHTIRVSYRDELAVAVQFMKDCDLTAAHKILVDLSLRYPDDGLVANFLIRCQDFMSNGIPADWDGIHILNLK